MLFCLFDRFVAISDLYEPTDDGTESQVRENQIYNAHSVFGSRVTQWKYYTMWSRLKYLESF